MAMPRFRKLQKEIKNIENKVANEGIILSDALVTELEKKN